MSVLAGASERVRDEAVTVLIAESALGAGLLAVVLAALAILVVFFDDYYRQILTAVPGGVAGAMLPYQTVAVVGAATAAIGLVTAVAWPTIPAFAQALLLGLTTWLLVWAAVGTVHLVNLTVFHGLQRARLLEAIHEARSRTKRPA